MKKMSKFRKYENVPIKPRIFVLETLPESIKEKMTGFNELFDKIEEKNPDLEEEIQKLIRLIVETMTTLAFEIEKDNQYRTYIATGPSKEDCEDNNEGGYE